MNPGIGDSNPLDSLSLNISFFSTESVPYVNFCRKSLDVSALTHKMIIIPIIILYHSTMKYKRSKQRERMLELLGQTEIHPTADWLYHKLKKEFPSLSLGTVYRNLNILTEQNLIQKLPFGSTHDRYEAQKEPHYHLVCEECGYVQDFHMPYYTDINEQAQKMSTFNISKHRIDFFGICEKCKQKRKELKHDSGKEMPGDR